MFKKQVKLCNNCQYSINRESYEDFESKLYCINPEANKNNIEYLTKIKSEDFIYSCRSARSLSDSCTEAGKYYVSL